MQLLGIIISLLGGGVLALIVGRQSASASRWLSLASLVVASIFYTSLWLDSTSSLSTSKTPAASRSSSTPARAARARTSVG